MNDRRIAVIGMAEGVPGNTFDPGFFGVADPASMPPSRRVFLMTAHHALEDAGYATGDVRAGLWAGPPESTVDDDTAGMLRLPIPAVGVAASASTGLVAVRLAVRALLDDEAELALAGHWDDASGASVLVLKHLDRALADGDRVHAVVLGVAVSHDPESDALDAAGVTAEDITTPRAASLAEAVRAVRDGEETTVGPRLASVAVDDAHVVIAQHHGVPHGARRSDSLPPVPALLPVSAEHADTLRELAAGYRARLEASPRAADVVTTAALGRRHSRHRLVVYGATDAEFAEGLDAYLSGARSERYSAYQASDRVRPVFAYTGLSEPGHTTAKALYDRGGHFRDVLDEAGARFARMAGKPLVPVILGDAAPEPGTLLPAQFAVQAGMTALLRHLGVRPHSVLGHGFGELAALHAAGGLSLADGMRLVTGFSALVEQDTPPGGMVTVLADRGTVDTVLAACPGLTLAMVNGPENHVLAGAAGTVDKACRLAKALDLRWQRVPVTRAYHAAPLDEIRGALRALAESVTWRAVQTPFLSGLDGSARPAGWTPGAAYVVAQSRQTVRFDAQLEALAATPDAVLLEVGTQPMLTRLVRAAAPGVPAIPSGREDAEVDAFHRAIGELHCAGVPVDWGALTAESDGRRTDLPLYPFRQEIIPPAPSTGDQQMPRPASTPVPVATGGRDALAEAIRLAAEAAATAARAAEHLASEKPVPHAVVPSTGSPDFGLCFTDAVGGGYSLLRDAAKFCEEHGLRTLWLPGRTPLGHTGPFPSAAVLATALAADTSSVRLHATVPVPGVVRTAEEWAMVDNLSGGRASLTLLDTPDADVAAFDAFWLGSPLDDVVVHPTPVQHDAPLSLRAESHEDFARAGRLGVGIVADLLTFGPEELRAGIGAYRAAGGGRVVVELFAHLATDLGTARREAFDPLARVAAADPQFLAAIGADPAGDTTAEFRRAYTRFCETRTLIGTPASAAPLVESLRDMGVDELAAIIDFGVSTAAMRDGWPLLAELRREFAPTRPALPAPRKSPESTGVDSPEFIGYSDDTVTPLRSVASVDKAAAYDGVTDHAADDQAASGPEAGQRVNGREAESAREDGRPTAAVRPDDEHSNESPAPESATRHAAEPHDATVPETSVSDTSAPNASPATAMETASGTTGPSVSPAGDRPASPEERSRPTATAPIETTSIEGAPDETTAEPDGPRAAGLSKLTDAFGGRRRTTGTADATDAPASADGTDGADGIENADGGDRVDANAIPVAAQDAATGPEPATTANPTSHPTSHPTAEGSTAATDQHTQNTHSFARAALDAAIAAANREDEEAAEAARAAQAVSSEARADSDDARDEGVETPRVEAPAGSGVHASHSGNAPEAPSTRPAPAPADHGGAAASDLTDRLARGPVSPSAHSENRAPVDAGSRDRFAGTAETSGHHEEATPVVASASEQGAQPVNPSAHDEEAHRALPGHPDQRTDRQPDRPGQSGQSGDHGQSGPLVGTEASTPTGHARPEGAPTGAPADRRDASVHPDVRVPGDTANQKQAAHPAAPAHAGDEPVDGPSSGWVPALDFSVRHEDSRQVPHGGPGRPEAPEASAVTAPTAAGDDATEPVDATDRQRAAAPAAGSASRDEAAPVDGSAAVSAGASATTSASTSSVVPVGATGPAPAGFSVSKEDARPVEATRSENADDSVAPTADRHTTGPVPHGRPGVPEVNAAAVRASVPHGVPAPMDPAHQREEAREAAHERTVTPETPAAHASAGADAAASVDTPAEPHRVPHQTDMPGRHEGAAPVGSPASRRVQPGTPSVHPEGNHRAAQGQFEQPTTPDVGAPTEHASVGHHLANPAGSPASQQVQPGASPVDRDEVQPTASERSGRRTASEANTAAEHTRAGHGIATPVGDPAENPVPGTAPANREGALPVGPPASDWGVQQGDLSPHHDERRVPHGQSTPGEASAVAEHARMGHEIAAPVGDPAHPHRVPGAAHVDHDDIADEIAPVVPAARRGVPAGAPSVPGEDAHRAAHGQPVSREANAAAEHAPVNRDMAAPVGDPADARRVSGAAPVEHDRPLAPPVSEPGAPALDHDDTRRAPHGRSERQTVPEAGVVTGRAPVDGPVAPHRDPGAAAANYGEGKSAGQASEWGVPSESSAGRPEETLPAAHERSGQSMAPEASAVTGQAPVRRQGEDAPVAPRSSGLPSRAPSGHGGEIHAAAHGQHGQSVAPEAGAVTGQAPVSRRGEDAQVGPRPSDSGLPSRTPSGHGEEIRHAALRPHGQSVAPEADTATGRASVSPDTATSTGDPADAGHNSDDLHMGRSGIAPVAPAGRWEAPSGASADQHEVTHRADQASQAHAGRPPAPGFGVVAEHVPAGHDMAAPIDGPVDARRVSGAAPAEHGESAPVDQQASEWGAPTAHREELRAPHGRPGQSEPPAVPDAGAVSGRVPMGRYVASPIEDPADPRHVAHATDAAIAGQDNANRISHPGGGQTGPSRTEAPTGMPVSGPNDPNQAGQAADAAFTGIPGRDDTAQASRPDSVQTGPSRAQTPADVPVGGPAVADQAGLVSDVPVGREEAAAAGVPPVRGQDPVHRRGEAAPAASGVVRDERAGEATVGRASVPGNGPESVGSGQAPQRAPGSFVPRQQPRSLNEESLAEEAPVGPAASAVGRESGVGRRRAAEASPLGEATVHGPVAQAGGPVAEAGDPDAGLPPVRGEAVHFALGEAAEQPAPGAVGSARVPGQGAPGAPGETGPVDASSRDGDRPVAPGVAAPLPQRPRGPGQDGAAQAVTEQSGSVQGGSVQDVSGQGGSAQGGPLPVRGEASGPRSYVPAPVTSGVEAAAAVPAVPPAAPEAPVGRASVPGQGGAPDGVQPPAAGQEARSFQVPPAPVPSSPTHPYLKRLLAAPVPVLSLPADRLRTGTPSQRFGVEECELGLKLTGALARLGDPQGPDAPVLAGVAITLRRFTGQDDLIIGRADGPPVRVDLGGDPSFAEVLHRVRTSLAEAAGFDGPAPEVPVATAVGAPAGEIGWSLLPHAGGATVQVGYAAELYEPHTARRLGHYLRDFLTAASEDPQQRLSQLDDLSDDDMGALDHWHRGPHMELPDAPVDELVAAHAARTPDAVAAVCGQDSLTYETLDVLANQLAHQLRGLGVGPSDVVGVLMPRDLRFIVSLLAVVKTGAAYLPLDPFQGPDAIAHILADSRAKLTVAETGLAGMLPEGAPRMSPNPGELAEYPGTPLERVAGPDDACYVVYDSRREPSGHGVVVSHRSVTNLCGWYHRRFRITAEDRASVLCRPGGDASVLEIWPALTAGAAIVVATDDVPMNAEDIAHWFAVSATTIAVLPTGLGEALLTLPDAARPADALRSLIVGGDPLYRRPRGDLPFEVVNAYGPTEATVMVASHTATSDGEGGVLLGSPIDNTRLYVLDGAGRPVPVGVPGELYVAGDCLASGYLHADDLTARRFPVDGAGQRYYRTGDLARWTNAGVLEFKGRINEQVPLGGHRVDPGEVAGLLRTRPGVADAAVVAVRAADGSPQLVAFIVPDGDPGDLTAGLPSHLIPSRWVTMDALPYDLGGRLDRDELLTALTPPEDRRGGPLASVQSRMAGFSERLGAALNIAVPVDLSGDLDTGLLKDALTRLAVRHHSLRSRFFEQDGTWTQEVLDNPEGRLALLDLTTVPEQQRGEHARQRAEAARDEVFDLADGHAWRAVLIRLGERDWRLCLVFHNLLTDDWARHLFLTELAELYNALTEGRPPRLPAPTQAIAYALNERRPDEDARMDYWTRRLDGVRLNLPLPYEAPDATGGSMLTEVPLPVEVVQSALALAQETGSTPYAVFAAALGVFLSKMTGAGRIVLRTQYPDRDDPRTTRLMASLATAAVLDLDIAPGLGFADLVGAVDQDHAEGLANHVALHLLLDALTERGANPPGELPQFLFPGAFVDDLHMTGLRTSLTSPPVTPGLPGTVFVCVPGTDTWHLGLSHSPAQLHPETATAWLDTYANVLAQLCAEPETPIGEL